MPSTSHSENEFQISFNKNYSLYIHKKIEVHSDKVVQVNGTKLSLSKIHVNGAKLSYDVGAKMSTPLFFHSAKMSIAQPGHDHLIVSVIVTYS